MYTFATITGIYEEKYFILTTLCLVTVNDGYTSKAWIMDDHPVD